MTFIKSFSIETDKQHPFPFNIPAVRFAKEITLDPKVTIFVGDNGCGKSTLLESMAYYLHIPLIGGHIASSASFEAAKLLKGYLRIEWKRQTAKGFFFRAEDFSDFINGVEREKNKIAGELSELKGNVRDSIIEELSMSDNMNYTLGKCARITCSILDNFKVLLKKQMAFFKDLKSPSSQFQFPPVFDGEIVEVGFI